MERKIAILLVMVIMATTLISCGGAASKPATSEQATPSDESVSGQQGTSEPATSEPVTLKLTGWRVEDKNAIDTMNEIFTQAYPNIKVEYNPISAGEYDSYLQTSLANKTAEDIIMLRSFQSGQRVYEGGNIVTLTYEDIPALKTFPDAAIKAWSSVDGKIFAVPGTHCIEGVHYNKKIFAECGITKTPETISELIDVCEKIKVKGYIPIACGIMDAWYVSEEVTSSILMALIGSDDWIKKLYNKGINFEDAKYVEMLQVLKDISKYFPPSFEGIDHPMLEQMFLSEQTAMLLSGSFEIQYFIETNPDLQFGGFAFPGKDAPPTAMNMTLVNGFGIYSETKHKAEALEYLNWLASKEGGQAYANNVAGFFSLNPEASDLQNPAAKEWASLKKDKELIHMLGYETMTDQSPDYTTAIGDAVYQMFVNGKTPQEAAAYMQEQMAWYFK